MKFLLVYLPKMVSKMKKVCLLEHEHETLLFTSYKNSMLGLGMYIEKGIYI